VVQRVARLIVYLFLIACVASATRGLGRLIH
jgi:hypothetical protein